MCWLAAIAMEARGRWRRRQLWLVGAAWAAPLIAGPPLVSKDIYAYAYATHGVMQRAGWGVYRATPTVFAGLHNHSAARTLAAVDPRWRHTGSPYGRLATALERVAAQLGAGDPLATLLTLRLIAVCAVLASAALAAALSAPRPTRGLVLVLLNPLLLVHGLSAAHFDAVVCALLLAAVWIAGGRPTGGLGRRCQRRRCGEGNRIRGASRCVRRRPSHPCPVYPARSLAWAAQPAPQRLSACLPLRDSRRHRHH